MCSGPKRKPTHTGLTMENEFQEQDVVCYHIPLLLELSALDDLIGFKKEIEEKGCDIDKPGLWYGRIIGSKRMGFEERTPLMIAALFGSKDVLNYILATGQADVNRRCGSDGATALHCAAAGGSSSSLEVVKILLDASADLNAVDSCGNHAGDLVAPVVSSGFYSRRKVLEAMLKGGRTCVDGCVFADEFPVDTDMQDHHEVFMPRMSKDGGEKKEYFVDLTLPDIKNGIYGTDEFRMFTFKVKPCSRAYSHDWTECPFVHPGENARRRDPRKYHYSCVPCPEFRKGSCRQGDTCEYAHGIFECWLHPAQYRTRLCKDETNCTRRVCFFAHKPEELRPLYPSTGSAVPSPRSFSANVSALDVSSISPLALGSPSVMIPPTSTPPMTPSGSSSPISGWPNQSSVIPPALQLPVSRLKSAIHARGMELDMELIRLESHLRRQQLMDEISGLSSPSSWNNVLSAASPFATSGYQTGEMNRIGVKPANLEGIFGSIDPTILPQLLGLSVDTTASQLQSPTSMQMRHNISPQLRSSYPTSFPSSPSIASNFSTDSTGAAAVVLSSRSAAFAKRSQSFIERNVVNRHSGFSSPTSSPRLRHSNLSDWASPDGKLDWGIQGEELHKLRKSASFGIRSNAAAAGAAAASMSAGLNEPDVSWVQSVVKDPANHGQMSFEEQQQQFHLNAGGLEVMPAWVEQLYMEQEQMVA